MVKKLSAENQKARSPRKNISVGNGVIVKDDSTKRALWKVALISGEFAY